MELKTNVLYYGDNLEILRKYIPDNSIDLIYLDPPFSSNKDYNVIFREATGKEPEAQIRAFEDTWHWDRAAEDTYQDIIVNGPPKVANFITAMRDGIGRNDVMAYLVMMTVRLLELYRVLKGTGSLYLHCDPTASHYLKLVLDQIFGPTRFRREIVWRSGWVSGFKSAAKNWVRNHDILLFYTKSDKFTFNKIYIPHPKDYKRRGGGERKEGVPLDDVWTDIYSPWIMSFSKEKLGYATQKPLALLERIIKASSNEGDVVLDPFCGCGTALVAAQKLNRRWIGIDITHLAINIMKRRLQDSFPGIQFEVIGEPKDFDSACALAQQDRYQFQWWALSLVGAKPLGEKRKGADEGIDGVINFIDDLKGKTKRAVVQVKSGHISVKDIRELKSIVAYPQNAIGIFITLAPPTEKMRIEAVSAGYHHSPLYSKDYPKIQILTIEELLRGKKVDMPPTSIKFLPEAPEVSTSKQLPLKGV